MPELRGTELAYEWKSVDPMNARRPSGWPVVWNTIGRDYITARRGGQRPAPAAHNMGLAEL